MSTFSLNLGDGNLQPIFDISSFVFVGQLIDDKCGPDPSSAPLVTGTSAQCSVNM